jgi:hypothetical protein
VEVLNHQHVHRPYKQDIELAFLIFDIEIELAQVESDPLANARKRVVAIKNHSCTEMMVASKVRVVSGAIDGSAPSSGGARRWRHGGGGGARRRTERSGLVWSRPAHRRDVRGSPGPKGAPAFLLSAKRCSSKHVRGERILRAIRFAFRRTFCLLLFTASGRTSPLRVPRQCVNTTPPSTAFVLRTIIAAGYYCRLRSNYSVWLMLSPALHSAGTFFESMVHL